MSRKSAPFWKTSRRCYYTRINGVLFQLDPDKDKADAMFNRLTADVAARLTVIELCELYLEYASTQLAPDALHQNRTYLRSWSDHEGRIRFEDMQPAQVIGWFARHPSWGEETRSIALSTLKSWSCWLMSQGYAKSDPLADLAETATTRRAPVSAGIIGLAHGDMANRHFRVFLELDLTAQSLWLVHHDPATILKHYLSPDD